MNKKIIIPILALNLLSACFKKEDPLVLPFGSSTITAVYLGQDYEKELFFDLGTNSYLEKKSADWDIRFESKPGGIAVFLNNGNLVSARKLGLYNLDEEVSSSLTFIKSKKELYDTPDGKIETSAFFDWKNYLSPDRTKSGIYVIDLGYIDTGYSKYKRIQFLESNANEYKIVVAELKNKWGKHISIGDTVIIPKDDKRNFTYYSFMNGGHIVNNPEPFKTDWDIQFTRYKHVFYGILPNNEPFPYRVSGVISNSNEVEISRDSLNRYSEIDNKSIPFLVFSKDWNVIGYDWKSHALGAAGNYTINPHLTYIIKDTKGDYYKLRFLDFYNSKGEKGHPKFEFEQIQ